VTPAQHRVYEAIKKLIGRDGYSPSFAEIGKEAGLTSLATVHKHVYALTRDGYITQQYNSSRSIALTPDKMLYGFHSCEQGHELIFYQSESCPLCHVIVERARQVNLG
jgi:SOS-response transcriptional repressor LexA